VDYQVKLTTKGKYGLRVMLELAMNYGGGPILVDRIAKRQEISGNYIHVLVTALRNAGLVRTTRGPGGGYELRQAPEEVSVLQIIEALEGKALADECVDAADASHLASAATVRDLWCEVFEMVEDFLSRQTLADLVKKQRAVQEAQVMYYI
jgi:Rrf2 family transcriptional regulator, cysteine metabolism repressor